MRTPKYVNDVINRANGEEACYDRETNLWLICRRTSERVPGKPNPVPKKIPVARCTPMGREEISNGPSVSVVPCICREYGISRVLLARRPVHWMKSAGQYSEALFLEAIKEKLPQSYLLFGREYSLPDGVINVHQRKKRLWEEYEREGITIEGLEPLRSLTWIHYPDRDVVTAATPGQEELLKKHGVTLI